MPTLAQATPKYRKHRPSGQAVVTLNGKDFYLGPYGTKASRAEYDRLIAMWLANGRRLPADENDLTIVEMLAAFRRHAVKHYRKNGRPTRSLGNIDDAVRPLMLFYGRELVQDFGPLELQTIQALMVTGYNGAKGEPVRGLSRTTVNARIGKIKMVFRWAVSREMAPPSLAHALDTVRGLQRGRTDAREREPVKPVDDAIVNATLEHLSPVVADMVRFQRLTGCRPGEVRIIRPGDVDRSADVWIYRPASHKMEHHDRERIIFIGPKAQEILRPYLLRAGAENCFSPAQSERKRLANNHRRRVTPLSCGNRPGTHRAKKPRRSPGGQYGKDAYNRAIARACKVAGVDPWSPNRLRHTAATQVRHKYGLEAAQVVLGHATANVTQIYAERDLQLAARIMREVG